MDTHLDIRPSAIAGRWYPAEASRLANTVDGYLQAAGAVQFSGQVVGVMAPHAGHQYSGPVAGYAFAALRGLHPETVVVLAPMHHPYSQPLLTPAHAAYRTPLGLLPVDRPSLQKLAEVTKGHYYEAASKDELKRVYQDMGSSIGYHCIPRARRSTCAASKPSALPASRTALLGR